MVQLALCNFLRFHIYSFIELFYTEHVNSCAYIHIVITAFEHRKQLASPEKCLCVCVSYLWKKANSHSLAEQLTLNYFESLYQMLIIPY